VIRLLLPLALLAFPAWAEPSIRVIDGDTIARGGETIRIVGMDAPETHHARCDAEREDGEKAKAALATLLASGPVEIIPSRRRDRYRRLLARVTVNGRDVAAVMIKAGHARPYSGGKRKVWC